MVPFIMWRRRQTFLILKLKRLLNKVIHFSTNVTLNLLQSISAFQPSDAAEDCRTRSALTVDLLSMGLMLNFLSLKEMFRISLQGNPIFGVILEEGEKSEDGFQRSDITNTWHITAWGFILSSTGENEVNDLPTKHQPCGQTRCWKLDRAKGKVAGGQWASGHRSPIYNRTLWNEWNHWFFDSLVLPLVDVQSLTVDSQPQLRALLVPDFKVVEAIHVQVLGDLQVLNHRLFPAQENRGSHTIWMVWEVMGVAYLK